MNLDGNNELTGTALSDKDQKESPLNTYFAIKPGKELADIVLGKSETFYNILNRNNYLNKIRKMWRYYYGIFGDVSGDHQINFTGEQGELVTLPVNHFRNLAQHIYTMITANRPIMEARAINTDYKSLSQTYLANGILDYYMREKGLENALKHACEMSIVMGAGFLKMDWNATAGEAYDADPETNKMDYEGEIEFTVLSPLDVVTDGTREKWDKEWACIRTFKNKYNLMAKYPEFAEKIQGLPTKSQMSSYYSLSIWSNDNTDDIPVYEFYHGKTEAIPEGRYMLFLSSDVVCIDMPLPYRVVPIFRVAPNNILGTPYGYSPMFDVFPLQEGINALYSTIMTNQNAFGVQNLWMPKGADINYSSLEGGLNVIESAIKPEPINLTQTPAEIFKFSDMLIQAAETISGVNSVARGNPEPSLKSGNALALIQSMAIQFISGLQQSYVQLIEQTGTSLIQILKDFALTPKIVALVGKNNKTFLKEFTGEDLHSINRVIVDMGNALSHTISGRVQMADNLLQYQLIKDPLQYFQVLNTGRLDAMFEGEMSELLCIKSENERMMDGEQVQAVSLDKHSQHIKEHKNVLADPDLRKEPDLVKTVLDHIQQHITLLQTTEPALLQMIGEQPLPPPQPPGAPPSNPQGPPQGAGPMPGPAEPPKGAIHKNKIPNVMGVQAGMAQPGESIQGPNQERNNLPHPAKPPKPFNKLPTNAKNILGQ
jgi:hypothetical protein